MPKKDTQFKPGESGNPAGRPKGSRNILSTAFLDALKDSFAVEGKAAIEKVAKDEPSKYLTIIASVLPKQIDVDVDLIRTVINAQPELDTSEWQKKHELSGDPSQDHKPH